MQQTDRRFWADLVCFVKEFWVEFALFCVFVALLFAVGIYLF